MRALAQPGVLRAAAKAAFLTALVCYPRLSLWANRAYPLWYLEAVLLLGGTVLWAFVFAWHAKYAGRPVFSLKVAAVPLGVATFSGLTAGVVLYFFVAPAMRLRSPEEYPVNFEQWFAMTLFSLAFTQLFLLFAPFAWLVRLFRKPDVAAIMTILFGMFVLWIKNHSSKTPFPASLLLAVLAVRFVVGSLSVYFLLRGGVFLVWWWDLLVQSRHLFSIPWSRG